MVAAKATQTAPWNCLTYQALKQQKYPYYGRRPFQEGFNQIILNLKKCKNQAENTPLKAKGAEGQKACLHIHRSQSLQQRTQRNSNKNRRGHGSHTGIGDDAIAGLGAPN